MTLSPRIAFAAVAAFALACPTAFSQAAVVADDGRVLHVSAPHNGSSSQVPGSLTTTFASNNQFAGNMFDISPAVDLEITGIDINVNSTVGDPVSVDVWYIPGTSFGNENSAAGWVLLGSYGGSSAGQDNPTFIDMAGNGMTFSGGQSYGMYVDLTSYGSQSLRYTNGGPTIYSNSDLSLETNCGKGDGGHSASTFFPREWNGTIYYDTKAGGCNLVLRVSGSCPGQMTFSGSGATPGGMVCCLCAMGPGSATIPAGTQCAGTVLGLDQTYFLAGITFADSQGNFSSSGFMGPQWCGTYGQVIDFNSCCVSNVVQL